MGIVPARIALEDGTVLDGESVGAEGESVGEVVFNTSLTGYQEIFTDPSYNGQMVVMTNPLIGNYGVNPDDEESFRPFPVFSHNSIRVAGAVRIDMVNRFSAILNQTDGQL